MNYLYLKLPKKDFVFIKKNNSFQSTINISINITDSLENKQITHDSWKHNIIENNYQKTREFGNNEILVKKINIKKGLYKIFIHIQDYDSKNKWSMREVVSLEGYKRISDILVNYKFYQKLFVLLIAFSTILIFPESPKELENICESYNSRKICNVW